MEEFNKKCLELIDTRAEQRRREQNYYLPYGKRSPRKKRGEIDKILLHCLNGMMYFWIRPYVKNKKIRQVWLDTVIPGPVLIEFARGRLELAEKQANVLFQYLKDHGDIVPIHFNGYDFEALGGLDDIYLDELKDEEIKNEKNIK